MLQNLLSELIGILVTAVLVDAFHAYRSHKKDHEYLRCVVESIRNVTSNATSLAFGFFGGRFLRVHRIDTPRDANVLASLIERLRDYNRDIDAIVDRYSILTRPEFILRLHFVIADIDRALHRLEVIYDWQVCQGPLRGDERVHQKAFTFDDETLREAAEFLGVGDTSSVQVQYQSLDRAYGDLDKLIAEMLARRMNFGRVLASESLLAELFAWPALRVSPRRTHRVRLRPWRRLLTRRRTGMDADFSTPERAPTEGADRTGRSFIASCGPEHVLAVWQARQQYAEVIQHIALTAQDPDDVAARVLFDVTQALSHLTPLVGPDTCELWRKKVGAPFVDQIYAAKANPSARRRLLEAFRHDWAQVLADVESLLPEAELSTVERKRRSEPWAQAPEGVRPGASA